MSTHSTEDPLNPQTWNNFRIDCGKNRYIYLTVLGDGKYVLHMGTFEGHMSWLMRREKLAELVRAGQCALEIGADAAADEQRGTLSAVERLLAAE